MAQSSAYQLLPQTAYKQVSQVIGDKVPAAAYYIKQNNMQTFTWNLTTFTGLLQIQATLADNPGNGDWFTIYNLSGNQLTQTSFTNISGNFVWVRAVINNFGFGVVQSVKVSY